jgi:hypothetical protein
MLAAAISSTPSPTVDQTTVTPSPTPGPTTVLPGADSSLVWAVAGTVILAGMVVIAGRAALAALAPKQPAQAGDSGASIVRSWIAISLVAGLLIFCAVTFAINDSTLRSTLFGGLVASVGAAVAFYFSSKSADQARQDVMSAALGTTEVPNLVGTPPPSKTIADARATISEAPLKLVVNDPNAADDYIVTGQSPTQGTSVRNGSKVSVKTRKPQ